MEVSDIFQQGMSCLRTDGVQNCTHYLFPNRSFPAAALASKKHLSLRLRCFIATRKKTLEIF